MSKTKKELKQDNIDLLAFKDLLVTYQDVASMRIRRTRSSVLKNREFIESLNEVYMVTKAMHSKEIKQVRKGDGDIFSFFKKNTSAIGKDPKVLAILVSANASLYGDIVKRVTTKYLEFAKGNSADLLVTGKVGNSLVSTTLKKDDYSYLELPDFLSKDAQLTEYNEVLQMYDEVYVFHPKFVSLMKQETVSTSISGGFLNTETSTTKEYNYKLIFEPSLKEVLEFFDTELAKANFVHVVHEANLSKFASRMVSLTASIDNVKNKADKVSILLQKAKHRENNKKQQNVLASRLLWNK